MNKVKEFFTANKYAIFWTIGYALATWCILKGMFNFDIFSSAQWSHLMRAQLRGFGGFVFGILLLAAAPLYIATTLIILQTKEPLFTLARPKIFDKLFKKPATTVATETAPTPQAESAQPPEPTSITFPENMPVELKVQFLRARQNIKNNALINKNKATKPDIATPSPSSEQTQSVASTTPTPKPTPVAVPEFAMAPTAKPTGPAPIPTHTAPSDSNAFPLPTDFDIDITDDFDSDGIPFMSAPTFTEITFDTPAPEQAATPDTTNTNVVAQYLAAQSRTFKMDGDIVITDTLAIASHTDNDFWIADDETWFAAGKSRPSPIADAIRVAGAHNLRPALYLGTTNIMDLDARREKWIADGVIIVDDLAALADN